MLAALLSMALLAPAPECCAELVRARVPVRCIADVTHLTVKVPDQEFFFGLVINEAMKDLAQRWFRTGGRTITFYFEKEELFLVCRASWSGGSLCREGREVGED